MDQTEAPACRHEYVRIYQRKLKGIERRLVSTKAWLPVGFKQSDFSHLGEGSYCFCSTCRARLYPKRTNAEKAQARLALAASKEAAADGNLAPDTLADDFAEQNASENSAAVNVEELEVESIELAEIGESGIDISKADDCRLATDE